MYLFFFYTEAEPIWYGGAWVQTMWMKKAIVSVIYVDNRAPF